MPTPKQLEDAEAEADRLIMEMAGDGTQDGSSDDGSATPDPGRAAGDESSELPPDPAPQAKDEPPAKAAEADQTELRAQLATLQAEFDKLQASYSTLRGKTYAEVPRVLAENRALLSEVADLKAKLAAKEAASTPAKLSAKSNEILASLKEVVAEETVDQIQQLVATQVEERLAERVGKVEGTVESLQTTARQRAEEAYVAKLTELVPDWEEKAGMPEYADFLSGRDELSGEVLHTLATRALNRLDAVQQAKFFKRFDAVQNPAGAAPKVPPVVPKTKEELLAPAGSARKADPIAGEEKQDRFTQRQLDQFNRNRRNMTPAQEAAMEARIDRAIQNRWIDP